MNSIIYFLLGKSRWLRMAVIGLMIFLIAFLDSMSGYNYSFFVFYFFPVSLTVWILGISLANLLIVLSILISMFIDLNAGAAPDHLFVCRWNGWTTIILFFISTYLLHKLKTLFVNLELLVKQRTEALEKKSEESRRLQEEILEVEEREQQRIACDLHDTVCQHLTGISLKTKSLEKELEKLQTPLAKNAARISQLVAESIGLTRSCAEGLFPMEILSEDLTDVINKIVEDTNQEHKIYCEFECDAPLKIVHQPTLFEIYRITQEAIRNVVKYSKASEVVIRLKSHGEWVRLEIQDDGVGISEETITSGIGLRVMRYRAEKIGAKFEISRVVPSGTLIACFWKAGV